MAEQHSQLLFSFGDATDSVIWKPLIEVVLSELVGFEFTIVKYSVIGDACDISAGVNVSFMHHRHQQKSLTSLKDWSIQSKYLLCDVCTIVNIIMKLTFAVAEMSHVHIYMHTYRILTRIQTAVHAVLIKQFRRISRFSVYSVHKLPEIGLH